MDSIPITQSYGKQVGLDSSISIGSDRQLNKESLELLNEKIAPLMLLKVKGGPLRFKRLKVQV